MASSSDRLFHGCFQDWINQQHQDLKELTQAIDTHTPDSDHLRRLIHKSNQHFQDYSAARAELSKLDAASFFCPSWITSFESSFLWLGGSRSSLYICLLYSISGSELQAQLADSSRAAPSATSPTSPPPSSPPSTPSTPESSFVKEEDSLSNKMASMQEDAADEPLASIANTPRTVGEYSRAVNSVIETHSRALSGLLEEADKVRLNTLKELQEILTPLQAADFLVVSKKLHLSMREWGKERAERV